MYASLVALSISPATVEFDVPFDGSTEVEFMAWDFNGNLGISLEDIPLVVEPTIVPVTAAGTKFILTLYGDPSLGSQIFEGKILFVGLVDGAYTVGIKVRATVHHKGGERDPLDTFIRTMEGIRPKCPVGTIETAWMELTERVIEITPAIKILPPG